MKKIIFVLAILFGGLSIFGQTGTTRTDGYNKITKGAFWWKRPEAKLIYEGGNPSGYKVIPVSSECYVRFVDGEHNSNDLNYIIFPKGAIIYQDISTSLYYAAICGNQIEFWNLTVNTKETTYTAKVHKFDTVHKTTYVYDTVVVYLTTINNNRVINSDFYYYGGASLYYYWGYYCPTTCNVGYPVVECTSRDFYHEHPYYHEGGRHSHDFGHYQTEPFHRRDENPRPKPTPNPGRGGDPITPVGRGGDPIVPVAPPVGSGIDPLKLAKAVESKAYRQQTTQTTQPAQNRAQANVQNARQQSAPQTYRQPSVQSQPAQARAQANVQPYRQPSAPQAYRPSSSYLAPSRSSNSGSGGVSRGQHR